MTLTDAPDVLTVPEFCRLARIGRNAGYQLVKSGRIRAVRIGASIRIPKSAVAAFLGGEEPAVVPELRAI